MGGKTDVVKGRIKEAAGVLTNNDKLRAAGRTDQAVGKVKLAAQKTVRAVKDTAGQAVKKAKDITRKSVNKAKEAAKSMSR